MTTLALSQLVHEAPAFLQRVGQHVSDFFAGIEEARVLAHRYQTLSEFSDEQLAARGIKREDIPQAVMNRGVRV
jgi:hypothetical protein